jgi:hypothetical protein
MRVAIIAFDFPPYSAGGSYRPFRFAKYLQRNKVDTVVFSICNYDDSDRLDSSFNDSDYSFKIIRTSLRGKRYLFNLFKEHYFSITERLGVRWRRSLTLAFKNETLHSRFDILIATAPPFSVLKEARILSKKFDIPLVVDFRDAWSQWCITPFATKIHYHLTIRDEYKSLISSSLFIVPTAEVGSDLIRIHGDRFKDKILLLPNGFDDYLPEGKNINWNWKPGSKLVIGYAGSFYYNPASHNLIYSNWKKKKLHQILQFVPRYENWLYRSPFYFFKGIRQLIDTYPYYADNLEIRIAGRQPSWIMEMVNLFNLSAVVDFCGQINQADMKKFYNSCDILLSTSIKIEAGFDYCIAGKTYEYFLMKKPILGLVCEGAQKKILQQSGMSIVCDPDSSDELVNAIRNINEIVSSLSVNTEYLSQFSIEHQGKLLYNSIENIIKTSNEE